MSGMSCIVYGRYIRDGRLGGGRTSYLPSGHDNYLFTVFYQGLELTNEVQVES